VSAWAPAGSERFRLYGGGGASDPVQNTGLLAVPTPAAAYAAEGKPWHPQSPLFAFGVLGLLTFGLMAVSTSGGASVRLGKTTATITGGAGIGKTS
jgi:hypothetical protein